MYVTLQIVSLPPAAVSNAQLEALISKSKVERDSLRIEKRIAFGRYGNVFSASWTRKQKTKTVIVKYLNCKCVFLTCICHIFALVFSI